MADIVLTSNANINTISASNMLLGNFKSSIQINSNILLALIELNVSLSGSSNSKIIIIGTNALGISESISGSISTITLISGTINLADETLSGSISLSHIINGWMEFGVIEILSGSSSSSSISSGYISFGGETAISCTSQIDSYTRGKLLIEVRCINCNFNSGKSLTKNGPKCFRNARVKDKELKTDCVMFKKIKD